MIDRPDPDRRVIPRWHSPAVHAGRLEGRPLADPIAAGIRLPKADLAPLIADFQENRHAVFASDLVGAALPAGELEEARDAAEFLMASPEAPRLARRVAARLLAGPSELQQRPTAEEEPAAGELQARLRVLRRDLADDPRNALAWAESARLYAIHGEAGRARRAMTVALGLAPYDRYILRSAARLWVHSKDPERAHRILADSSRTPSDPWLIAAEIGLAEMADRRSRLLRSGRAMLADLPPPHASELAASIGTVDLTAGQDRRARRLFETSLVEPNDNALAQAEWASERLRIPDLQGKLESVTSSYEARALDAAADGRPHDAATYADLWLGDEPYSLAAASFGSYQASKAGNFAHGAHFAARGLVPNPGDVSLLNNLAFCYAKLDRVEEAERTLSRVNLARFAAPEEVSLKATQGLVAFRKGLHEEGLRYYREALNRANNPTTKAIAWVMMATEIVRANPDEGRALADQAPELERDLDREARAWLRHLEVAQGAT